MEKLNKGGVTPMAYTILTEMHSELRQALAGERTPIFLATVGPDAQPNVVPVISIEPWA